MRACRWEEDGMGGMEREAPGRVPVHVIGQSGEVNWRVGAACRDADPELFFPEGTMGPAIEAATGAKRICGSCPVRRQCLEWALRHGADFGVWGGRTEDERRAPRLGSARRVPRDERG
jgi:WhiB family redox-sensing transcriptional regulator